MRCKACNERLEDSDLLRRDNELCSDCRYKGSEQYGINDLGQAFSHLTGVPMDGSAIRIEDYYENDISQE